MLNKLQKRQAIAAGARFAIVASEYNRRFVDAMLRAAKAELKRSGAAEITVIRVPGAFEIPVVAARLARAIEPSFAAILCLGVILRGATSHAQHIGDAVSQALTQIQVESGIPIIHEVLLLENPSQAVERCLNPQHNRGTEAAKTAVAMAQVMRNLPA